MMNRMITTDIVHTSANFKYWNLTFDRYQRFNMGTD